MLWTFSIKFLCKDSFLNTNVCINKYFFVGPPKEDIFLTTFCCLYFDQCCTYILTDYISLVGLWGQLSYISKPCSLHTHITHVCRPYIQRVYICLLFRDSTLCINRGPKRDSIHRDKELTSIETGHRSTSKPPRLDS